MLKISTVYDSDFFGQFIKLLAQENISRRIAVCDTAYFELDTRTVVIPKWHETLSEFVSKLLHCHEVSHAVYTPVANWHRYIKAIGGNMHVYLNVAEDARVDALMKAKYKGIRQVYANGYKELFDKGMFSTTDWDVYNNQDIVINRFNVAQKLSTHSQIQFKNQTEEDFMERGNKLKSFKQSFELAKDMMAYDVAMLSGDPLPKFSFSIGTGDGTMKIGQKELDRYMEEYQKFLDSLDPEILKKLQKMIEDVDETGIKPNFDGGEGKVDKVTLFDKKMEYTFNELENFHSKHLENIGKRVKIDGEKSLIAIFERIGT